MSGTSSDPGDTSAASADLIAIEVNGRIVEVDPAGGTLLDLLRDHLGLTAAKDGCSPQGQCGCCTVLVDGTPRVACVTPLRRLRGRSVTTLEGLDPDRSHRWADALCATGGSQCGFCTPGIILRLEGDRRGIDDPNRVRQALSAHLCRCTGWQTIVEAAAIVAAEDPVDRSGRDLVAAARRATIEGRAEQQVGPHVALGDAGFAADTVPVGALRAVRAADGSWMVGATVAQARARAGKTQGRRTTAPTSWPVAAPSGDWAAVLQTTWVEPAYLETDATWSVPGGEPVSSVANGGAFGGKSGELEVGRVARALADEHGRPVLVLASREDTVRFGPKRPPVSAAIRADGTGVLRLGVTGRDAEADAALVETVARSVAAVAPGITVEPVPIAGPPTSSAPRAVGWAEAAMLLAALTTEPVEVTSPEGAWARAVADDEEITVQVRCGQVLDQVVLRSYCVGAAHMAWSWVTSESLAVDERGEPLDLTVRSFGIARAIDTPPITVTVLDDASEPINGSDAVFAAVAAAVWRHRGCPRQLPTGRMAS